MSYQDGNGQNYAVLSLNASCYVDRHMGANFASTVLRLAHSAEHLRTAIEIKHLPLHFALIWFFCNSSHTTCQASP